MTVSKFLFIFTIVFACIADTFTSLSNTEVWLSQIGGLIAAIAWKLIFEQPNQSSPQ